MHWIAAHGHLVLAYGYEVFGGILIFYSSAVTETSLPTERRRRIHWFAFGAVALVYVVIGMAIRHAEIQQNDRNSQRSDEDRKELRENRDRMDSRMGSVLSSFQVTYSQLGSLSSEIGIMRNSLLKAMHKNDPQVITDLERQAQTAQQQLDNLSHELLALTMATQVAEKLREWDEEYRFRQDDLGRFEWEDRIHFESFKENHPNEKPTESREQMEARWEIKRKRLEEESAENLKALVATADFVRRELIQRLPPTQVFQIDKNEEQLFEHAINDPSTLDKKAAAAYLETLAKRVPPPK